ncbi:MAG TPA: hypothetical protein PLY70_07135 [Saprospiraceae bacterium]|nr:hypothetical protein [Saprospiraceae bacterium]HPN68449.1 hypothetical protein [Saprospiraceae bacterium]
MKTTNIVSLIVLISILLFAQTSCKKCNNCADEKLVTVPVGGSSTPVGQWEMSQAVQHSNGTVTSSISIVPESITLINSTTADSVTTNIYFTATDTISGIKCVKLSGGFGFTCVNNSNQAIILDGILPQKTQCLDLTTCCLKSQRIAYEDISEFLRCPQGRTFTNGGIGIMGIIENCNGQIDTMQLTVQF